jgi:hypothetical protein
MTLNDSPETLDPAKLRKLGSSYGLYAVPYIGNAQTLAASTQRPLAQAQSWKGLAKNLQGTNSTFYSRLGSNNSAVADFLPILWANGGCIVGGTSDHEVAGFTADGRTAAHDALDMSMKLAGSNPVQYTRFGEEDVYQGLQASSNAAGVSWLAYRNDKLSGSLRWYRMPDGEMPVRSPCQGSAEISSDGNNLRTGVLGMWALAVPNGSTNHDLGWTFIAWALKQWSHPAEQVASDHCSVSRELTDPAGVPTPFEDQLTCDVRCLIRHSRPRIADPDWHEIEAAVGLRIREAHWGMRSLDEAVDLAAEDVSTILNRRPRNNNQAGTKTVSWFLRKPLR